ncbi:MAG: acyl-CoA dehydratase activase-related protein [Chloroflexi bacterium]|nr:acyl-CoA dehydratase activase-related protein [Chloroflexota bacterium]
MGKRVVIPRALLYYQYFPMWKTFFDYLGAEVVTTGETTRSVLAQGSARVVAETCLPAKVYCGHVISIAEKADYVFIPSIRSLEPQVYNCSKFLGLPDLVRGTVKESPPVLDIEIDVNKGERKVREQIHWLGKHFTRNPFKINSAYEKALEVDRAYQRLMREEKLTPPEAIARMFGVEAEPEKPKAKRDSRAASGGSDVSILGDSDSSTLTIALVGHPYNIYDTYINHNLMQRLKSLGVRLVTPEIAPEGALDLGTAKLAGKPYWTFEDEVVGAAGHYLDTNVDGLICIVCFGCGPDSMMTDIIQRAAKARGNKPLITLTLDEHTGEAGLVTRLEAFVDMLYRRRADSRRLARASV